MNSILCHVQHGPGLPFCQNLQIHVHVFICWQRERKMLTCIIKHRCNIHCTVILWKLEEEWEDKDCLRTMWYTVATTGNRQDKTNWWYHNLITPIVQHDHCNFAKMNSRQVQSPIVCSDYIYVIVMFAHSYLNRWRPRSLKIPYLVFVIMFYIYSIAYERFLHPDLYLGYIECQPPSLVKVITHLISSFLPSCEEGEGQISLSCTWKGRASVTSLSHNLSL